MTCLRLILILGLAPTHPRGFGHSHHRRGGFRRFERSRTRAERGSGDRRPRPNHQLPRFVDIDRAEPGRDSGTKRNRTRRGGTHAKAPDASPRGPDPPLGVVTGPVFRHAPPFPATRRGRERVTPRRRRRNRPPETLRHHGPRRAQGALESRWVRPSHRRRKGPAPRISQVPRQRGVTIHWRPAGG